MLKQGRKCLKGWAGFFVLAAVIVLNGCSKPVATVDGKKIEKSAFDLHLKEKIDLGKRQSDGYDIKRLGETVLQELIVETLILNEAMKMEITVTNEELEQELLSSRRGMDEASFQLSLREKGLTPESYRARMREKMIMSKFISGLVGNAVITEEEMMAYYKNRTIPFIKPGRVLVKMIEVPSAEEAARLADEIKTNKADFDSMAQGLEEAKKAVVIGYGWVSPDMLSPHLSQALKNLGAGRQGGPYRGSKYYYLVRVKDKEPETIAKYEEVRENIRKTLLEQKRQQALSQWVQQKRNTAKIEIHTM